MKSLRGLMITGLTALLVLGSTSAWALPAAALDPLLRAAVAGTPIQPLKNDQGEDIKMPYEDQEQAECVSKCQEPMSRCMNQCKRSDKNCPTRCAERMVSCTRSCGMKTPNPHAVKKAQGGNHKH